MQSVAIVPLSEWPRLTLLARWISAKNIIFLLPQTSVLSFESDPVWNYSQSKTAVYDAFFQVANFIQQKVACLRTAAFCHGYQTQKHGRGHRKLLFDLSVNGITHGLLATRLVWHMFIKELELSRAHTPSTELCHWRALVVACCTKQFMIWRPLPLTVLRSSM